MSIDVLLGTDTASVLDSAILLYRSTSHGSGSGYTYASVHSVVAQDDAAPRIMPGRALTEESLQAAVQALAEGGKKKPTGLQWHDPRLIASMPGLECWWTPARERWMHFDSSGIKASLPAAQPACLWVRKGKSLYVYALATKERPGPETLVFKSPYYNVYEDGAVCQGSMPGIRKLTLEQVEDTFFASVFTHANPTNRKLVKSRFSNAKFWLQRLQAGPKKPFPVHTLLPMNITVEQLLRAFTTTKR